MFNDIQECPHCGCSLARDCFGQITLADSAVTYLHCEFDGVVRETFWIGTRSQFNFDHWFKQNPVEYGKALQRLTDSRTAGSRNREAAVA